jgi:hypothetical protein
MDKMGSNKAEIKNAEHVHGPFSGLSESLHFSF